MTHFLGSTEFPLNIKKIELNCVTKQIFTPLSQWTQRMFLTKPKFYVNFKSAVPKQHTDLADFA